MRKLNCALNLSYDTIAKQKAIYQASLLVESKQDNTLENVRKKAVKRKLPMKNDTDEESVVDPKLTKTNNLFQGSLNAVENQKKLSAYLNREWMVNLSKRRCVR